MNGFQVGFRTKTTSDAGAHDTSTATQHEKVGEVCYDMEGAEDYDLQSDRILDRAIDLAGPGVNVLMACRPDPTQAFEEDNHLVFNPLQYSFLCSPCYLIRYFYNICLEEKTDEDLMQMCAYVVTDANLFVFSVGSGRDGSIKIPLQDVQFVRVADGRYGKELCIVTVALAEKAHQANEELDIHKLPWQCRWFLDDLADEVGKTIATACVNIKERANAGNALNPAQTKQQHGTSTNDLKLHEYPKHQIKQRDM